MVRREEISGRDTGGMEFGWGSENSSLFPYIKYRASANEDVARRIFRSWKVINRTMEVESLQYIPLNILALTSGAVPHNPCLDGSICFAIFLESICSTRDRGSGERPTLCSPPRLMKCFFEQQANSGRI